MNNFQNKKDGFIALAVVTLIGFFMLFFVISTMNEVWYQATGVEELKALEINKFLAMSCVNIARLKIYLNEILVEGEYEVRGGKCVIEKNQRVGNFIQVQTSAGTDIGFARVKSTIDADSLEIIFISD